VGQPVFEETRRLLEDAGLAVEENPGPGAWSQSELAHRCADAEALVAFMTERVDAAFLEACPRLRVVASALKGFDNLDVEACSAAGVWLTIVPDLLTAPTAELAVGLAIGLCRNVAPGDARVRSGRFQGWRPVLYGAGLAGATIGVAGVGRVGSAIARRLSGFQPARVVGFDARPGWPAEVRAAGIEPMPFEDLLEASDLLFLALPLTPATRHLVADRALERIRRGCRIVNVGRGGVVDEAAVARALAAGRLAGYAADVFELEDWAVPDRPREVHPALLASRDRTLFTPHLGSAVAEVRRRIEETATQNLLAALSNRRPPNAINDPSPAGLLRRARGRGPDEPPVGAP
jgi:phosphonate dehydrogenase